MTVRPENFTYPYDSIYREIIVYYKTVQTIINYDHFVDILKRRHLEDEELNQALQAFVELRDSPPVQENEFRYQIIRLREITKVDMFTGALVDTMDVLMSGKRQNGKLVLGYDAAIATLQKKIVEISRDDVVGTQFFGRQDITRIISSYSDRKFGRTRGFSTSFSNVDDVTSGGFQAGDLVFLAGYTSEGKSTLLNTMVDYWVFGGPKLNVALGTAESTPDVVYRNLVSIRSCDQRYGGPPLAYKAIKEGRLGTDGERQLEKVVYDMANNKHYGNLHVFSIPNGATTSTIFELVSVVNQMFPVHIFAWDYCGYTMSDVKRGTDREEMGHIVRTAKVRSANFDNNRGITTVSPFQVSRGKWEKAIKDGRYTLACMEETSAAEKAADIVWSVLQLEGGKTVGQVLKNRDGAKHMDPFDMEFDSQHKRFLPTTKSLLL